MLRRLAAITVLCIAFYALAMLAIFSQMPTPLTKRGEDEKIKKLRLAFEFTPLGRMIRENQINRIALTDPHEAELQRMMDRLGNTDYIEARINRP